MATIRVQGAPGVAGLSVGGRAYSPDADGFFVLDAADAAHLLEHGHSGVIVLASPAPDDAPDDAAQQPPSSQPTRSRRGRR